MLICSENSKNLFFNWLTGTSWRECDLLQLAYISLYFCSKYFLNKIAFVLRKVLSLIYQKRKNMTQAIQITKGKKVIIPIEYQKEEGCVAFQKIEISYTFYGSKQTDVFDTKILFNGNQVVIGGNGFIKDGFQIN